MSESMPGGLPPHVPVPHTPAAGDFDAVARVAAHRRRARALQVLSASAVVAVVLAALAVGPTGAAQDQLNVAQAEPSASAEAAPSAEPTPAAEPSASPAATEPQPQPTPDAEASTAQQASPDPAPQATPAGEPEEEPGTAPVPASEPGTEVGPPAERTQTRAGATCDGSGPTPAQGWCSYYDGAVEGKVGDTVTLAAAVCRMNGQGNGKLFADSGQHAEFDVGGRWSWGHGRRFSSDPTTFTVQPGECIRWFVSWDLTDNAGNPLPPGTYNLEALPLVNARSTESGTSAYVDNNYSFRITG